MDKRGVEKVSESAEKLAEAVRGSYEAAIQNAAIVQESNTRLARSLFESNIEALKVQAEIQAEINHQALQSLAEQIRKNRKTFEELSRGSLDAYDGFLGSLSSYHEEVTREPEKSGD